MSHIVEFTVTLRAELGGETDKERLEEVKTVQKECLDLLRNYAFDTWNWTDVQINDC